MMIRKYYASNPREAFNQIRAELGSDAIILQSEKVNKRGWLGFLGSPVYEISAGVDAREGGGPDAPGVDAPRQPRPAADVPPHTRSSLAAEMQDMRASIVQMQESIHRLNRNGNGRKRLKLPPHLARLRDLLISRGLDDQTTQDVVQRISFELSRRGAEDWSIVRDAAIRQLEGRFATIDLTEANGGKPAIIFVVGPSGAGKTTTVAKLAAKFSAGEAASVCLISTDMVRIGAIPQLRSYADIFGLPMKIAYTPAELARHIETFSNADVILVDTPGCSPKSVAKTRLGEFVKSADNSIVLLAIGATTRVEDALRAVEGLDGVPIHGVIITKLDETCCYGSVINLAHRLRLPTAYIATGPNVPDDIEPASARVIATTVVGG